MKFDISVIATNGKRQRDQENIAQYSQFHPDLSFELLNRALTPAQRRRAPASLLLETVSPARWPASPGGKRPVQTRGDFADHEHLCNSAMKCIHEIRRTPLLSSPSQQFSLSLPCIQDKFIMFVILVTNDAIQKRRSRKLYPLSQDQ